MHESRLSDTAVGTAWVRGAMAVGTAWVRGAMAVGTAWVRGAMARGPGGNGCRNSVG